MAAAAPAGAGGGGGGAGGGGIGGSDFFNKDSKLSVKMQCSQPPTTDEDRTQRGLKHAMLRKRPNDYRTLALLIPVDAMGGGAFSLDMINDERLRQRVQFFIWLCHRLRAFHAIKSKEDLKRVNEQEKALLGKEAARDKRVAPVGRQYDGIGAMSNVMVDRKEGDDNDPIAEAGRRFDLAHRKDNEDAKEAHEVLVRKKKEEEDLQKCRELIQENQKMPAVIVSIEACLARQHDPHPQAREHDLVRPVQAYAAAPIEDLLMERGAAAAAAGGGGGADEFARREPEVKVDDENKVAYVRLRLHVFDPEGKAVEKEVLHEGKQYRVLCTSGYRVGKVLSDYFDECENFSNKPAPADKARYRKGPSEPILPDHPFTRNIRSQAQFALFCRGVMGSRAGGRIDDGPMYPFDDSNNPLCIYDVFSETRAFDECRRRVATRQCEKEYYAGNYACPYRHLMFYPRELRGDSLWTEILPWKHSITIVRDPNFRAHAEAHLHGEESTAIYRYVKDARVRLGQPEPNPEKSAEEFQALQVYLQTQEDKDGKWEKNWVKGELEAARANAAMNQSAFDEIKEEIEILQAASIMKKIGAALWELAVDEYTVLHQQEQVAYVDKSVIRSWNNLRASMHRQLVELDSKLSEDFKRDGTPEAQQRIERAEAFRRTRESRLRDFIRIASPENKDSDISPFQHAIHVAIAAYLQRHRNFVRKCFPMAADANATVDAFIGLRNDLEKAFDFVHTHETWIAAALAVMYVYSGDPFPIHMFLYGDEGCGKSFVTESLRDILIERSALNIQKETEQSMSAGTNMDDYIFLQDEIRPEDWRGRDGKSGNFQATLKTRMSRGEMENLFLQLQTDGPRVLRFTRTQCKTAMIIAMNLDPFREIERPIQARAAIKKMGLGPSDDAKIVEKNAVTHRGPEFAPYRDDVKVRVQHWQMLSYLIFKMIYCGFLDEINVDVASDIMLKILKEAAQNGIRTARNVRNAHRIVCMTKSIVVYRVIQERFCYYPLFDEDTAFAFRDLLSLGPFLVATEQDVHLAMELLKFQFQDTDAEEVRIELIKRFFSREPADLQCPFCHRSGVESAEADCKEHKLTSKYVAKTEDGANPYDWDTFEVNFDAERIKWATRDKQNDPEVTMVQVLRTLLPTRCQKGLEATVRRLAEQRVKSVKDKYGEFGGEGELKDEVQYIPLTFTNSGFRVARAWIWSAGLDTVYEKAFSKVMTYAGQNPNTVFLASGLRPESDFSRASFAVWNYRQYIPDPKAVITVVNSYQLSAKDRYIIKQTAGKKARFDVNRVALPVASWTISENATIHAITEHIKRMGVSAAELARFKTTSPLFLEDELEYRRAYFANEPDRLFFRYDLMESELSALSEKDRAEADRLASLCVQTRPKESEQKYAAPAPVAASKGRASKSAAAAAASAHADKENKEPASAAAFVPFAHWQELAPKDSHRPAPIDRVYKPAGRSSSDSASASASASAAAAEPPLQGPVVVAKGVIGASYSPSSSTYEELMARENSRQAAERQVAQKRKAAAAAQGSEPLAKRPNHGACGGGQPDQKHSAGAWESREVSLPETKTPSPPRVPLGEASLSPQNIASASASASAAAAASSVPPHVPAHQRFPKVSDLQTELKRLLDSGASVGTRYDVDKQSRDAAYQAQIEKLNRQREEEARRAASDDVDMVDESAYKAAIAAQDAEEDSKIREMDIS